jgi:NADH-quinone oxidoreductase subunit H
VPPAAGFILYLAKTAFVVGLISLMRTVAARMRIDQMIEFCWKYLVPLGMAQLLINFLIKGIILR